MNTLGAKIRKLRTQQRLTQAQLGGKRLTKGFISQLEHDKVNPSFNTLIYLSEQLGISVLHLMENSLSAETSSARLTKHLQILIKNDRLEEAINYGHTVIHHSTINGTLHELYIFRLHIGRTLYRLSRYTEALQEFQEIDDATNISKSANVIVECIYWMANCHFKLEEFSRAAKFYRRVIERCSQSKMWKHLYDASRVYYASCCVRANKISEALQMYYEVYNDSNDTGNHKLSIESGLGLAWSMYLSGRTLDALKISQSIERTSAKICGYWAEKIDHNKAIYLRDIGNLPQARHIWRSLSGKNTLPRKDFVMLLE